MKELLEKIKKQIELNKDKDGFISDEEVLSIVNSYDLNEKDKDKIINYIENTIFNNDYEKDSEIINENIPYSNNSIRDYLIEISKYNLLTTEEELALFSKIKQLKKILNDDSISSSFKEHVQKELDSSKKAATESNLRLVVCIAKNYNSKTLDLLDLIQEGNIGLITAIDKYDVDKGYKFSTYASWWIRQAVTRSIAEKSRTIRIPVHAHEKFQKIGRLMKTAEAEGIELSKNEIIETLNISEEIYELYKKFSKQPVSLQTPVGEDQETPLEELIVSDDKSIEEIVDSKVTRQAILDILDNKAKGINLKITELQKEILLKRTGFDGTDEQSLLEIGDELNVTCEAVRQSEKRVLKKIRRSPKAMKYLDEQKYEKFSKNEKAIEGSVFSSRKR